MRTAIAALALGACAPQGAAPPSSPLSPVASAPTLDASSPADSGVSVPWLDASALTSLDALASRASALAPGMREVARGDLEGGPTPVTSPLARAEAADTCVRVAFVAAPPAHAWLTDARGDVLADAPSTGDATLAARGPVCVRRGDAVTLHVESSAAWRGRFVGWASP
jgi:hypothetical protein